MDWPGRIEGPRTMLSTSGPTSMVGQWLMCSGNLYSAAAAWPSANLALYVPVVLEVPATVYKMSFIVGAQAGNYDVGIYDLAGTRLVSLGSTAVPAAGLAVADVADTALTPGVYYLAMNCSTVTTLTIQRTTALTAPGCRAVGMQQQAVGATALPATATFANPSNNYVPLISAHLVATV